MKITAEDQYKMERHARREAEIEQGRINHKRVHKSDKAYNRQRERKFNWAE